MMQARHRQQRRDRRQFRRNAAVGQNQNIRAVGDGLVGRGKQFFQRRFQAFRAVRRLEQNRQRDGFETGSVNVPQLLQFLVGEDRMLQLDQRAAFRRRVQQIASRRRPSFPSR